MQEIDYVLKWLKKRNSENKMKIKKIKVNELKDWSSDSGGNLFHKSKQFFGVMGIKVTGANEREIVSWDQPILTQKHGGILAILMREKKSGIIEFLLCARREPGRSPVLSIVTALSACPLVGIRAVENLGRPLFEGHPCFLEFLDSKKQRSDPY